MSLPAIQREIRCVSSSRGQRMSAKQRCHCEVCTQVKQCLMTFSDSIINSAPSDHESLSRLATMLFGHLPTAQVLLLEKLSMVSKGIKSPGASTAGEVPISTGTPEPKRTLR